MAAGDRGMAASAAPVCAFDDQESGGGVATLPGVVAWNAGAAFSQFAAARAKVGAKQGKITIAHLDTGFDPAHRTLPAGLVAALQRNFVDDGGGPNNATDRAPAGTLTSNRGHGTGTLSLLAGNKLAGNSPGWAGLHRFRRRRPASEDHPGAHRRLGGPLHHQHHGARLRLCPRQGRAGAVDEHGRPVVERAGRCHQPCLRPRRRHGDRRGNNFAGVPSPKSIVFPARYQRVIAACGVMADGRAYAGLELPAPCRATTGRRAR